jgi:hypothetical protein
MTHLSKILRIKLILHLKRKQPLSHVTKQHEKSVKENTISLGAKIKLARPHLNAGIDQSYIKHKAKSLTFSILFHYIGR